MTQGETVHPHQNARILAAGTSLNRAKAVVVMVHGRGADGHDMLSLADSFVQPDLAYLAPQAAGRSWYPYILPRSDRPKRTLLVLRVPDAGHTAGTPGQ